MSESNRYVVLKGLEQGNEFFSMYTPGTDATKLADGTVAYRVLGYTTSVRDAQIMLRIPEEDRVTHND